MAYLTESNVMKNDALELAKMFNNTKAFFNNSMLSFLDDR